MDDFSQLYAQKLRDRTDRHAEQVFGRDLTLDVSPEEQARSAAFDYTRPQPPDRPDLIPIGAPGKSFGNALADLTGLSESGGPVTSLLSAMAQHSIPADVPAPIREEILSKYTLVGEAPDFFLRLLNVPAHVAAKMVQEHLDRTIPAGLPKDLADRWRANNARVAGIAELFVGAGTRVPNVTKLLRSLKP